MHRISKAGKISRSVLITIGVLVLALTVAGTILFDYRAAARDKAQTDDWSLIVPGITSSDHTMGDLNAPVQVIVYSDFQCKYCGPMFLQVIPALQKQFGNNIVIAYRQLPLPAEPQAEEDAEASECIYRLGGNAAFWRFATIMYNTPGFYNGIDLSTLPQIAARAGVNSSRFNACMSSGGGKAIVAQEKLQGSVAGLGTTPSTVLKSSSRAIVVVDNYYAPLAAAIEDLLGDATSSPPTAVQ